MSLLRFVILLVAFLPTPVLAIACPLTSPTMTAPDALETQLASNGDGFLAVHLVKVVYDTPWPTCYSQCPKNGQLLAAFYDQEGILLNPILRPLGISGSAGKVSLTVVGRDYVVTNGHERVMVRSDGAIEAPVTTKGTLIASNGTRSIESADGFFYVVDASFDRVLTIPPVAFFGTVIGKATLGDGTIGILTIAGYEISVFIYSSTGEMRSYRMLGRGLAASIADAGDHFLAAWGRCDRCDASFYGDISSQMVTVSRQGAIGPSLPGTAFRLVRTGNEVQAFGAADVRRVTLDGKFLGSPRPLERHVRSAAWNGRQLLVEGVDPNAPKSALPELLGYAAPPVSGSGRAAGNGVAESPAAFFSVSAHSGQGVVAWNSMEGRSPQVRFSRFTKGGTHLDGPGRVVYPEAGVPFVASSSNAHLIVTVPIDSGEAPVVHLINGNGWPIPLSWRPRSGQVALSSDGEDFLVIATETTPSTTLILATLIRNGTATADGTIAQIRGAAHDLNLLWDGRRYLLTFNSYTRENWRSYAEHAIRLDRTGVLLEELTQTRMHAARGTAIDCSQSECIRATITDLPDTTNVEVRRFRHDEPLAKGWLRIHPRGRRYAESWTLHAEEDTFTVVPRIGDVIHGMTIEGDGTLGDADVPEWFERSTERLFFRFEGEVVVLFSAPTPSSGIPQLFIRRLEESRRRPVRR
jgi:hypothetical protein